MEGKSLKRFLYIKMCSMLYTVYISPEILRTRRQLPHTVRTKLYIWLEGKIATCGNESSQAEKGGNTEDRTQVRRKKA